MALLSNEVRLQKLEVKKILVLGIDVECEAIATTGRPFPVASAAQCVRSPASAYLGIVTSKQCMPSPELTQCNKVLATLPHNI